MQQTALTKLPEGKAPNRFPVWRSALLHALPVAAAVLACFYYWFAVANRSIVFLYDHDMGPLYPNTSAFSRVTSSRYWMAGLVASGAVGLVYTLASWLLGSFAAGYRSPGWQRVWTVCAALLAIGVPAITMMANTPTLPAWNAVQVTVATLIGISLALRAGELAASAPLELAWLAADGIGLASVMLNIIHIQDIPRWLDRGRIVWVWMTAIGLAGGLMWLLVVTALGWWRRRRIPPARALFAAGLCMAYLLLPLTHHTLGTDGYYYISDSDNFFARDVATQIVSWLVSAALALGVTALRHLINKRK